METASVIVPAYNAEKTIGKCLKALESQTRKPKEIIVVDDGSRDNTAKAAKEFRGVKLIKQKHSGPAAARNRGAKRAAGSILVFTDADCEPAKSWLSNMLKPFSDKKISGVQGAYSTEQNSLIARFAQCEISERYAWMKSFKYIDFIGTYSAAYRKKDFLDAGGFDESFPIASGEDPEFSFRLAERGKKLVFNPDAVVYHAHPNTLKKYLRQKFWRAYWRVRVYKKHPKKVVRESYTPQIIKAQIVLFYLFLISLILLPVFNTLLIAAALFIILVLSTLQETLSFCRRDRAAGIIAPVIILLRTVVFSAGLVFGNLTISPKP